MKRKLPNATAVLILGILSVPTCICYGAVGLILGIVALVLAHKDEKIYRAAPDEFENYSYILVGRIFALIGLVLSAIFLAFFLYILSMSPEERESFRENLELKLEQQREMEN